MILKKPKFWDSKISFYSIILYPFTLLVMLGIFFKKTFIKPIQFNLPIICVGNIYLGGTGKTPVSILLGNELIKLGRKPVIMRKYYKDQLDEHNLIKANFRNLILDEDRVNGIQKAKQDNYDSVILDDGFQDYKIKKDLNIVCFNTNQLVGNGLVLPSGPLRESLKSLDNAHIVLLNGDKNKEFEKEILNTNNSLKIFYSYYRPVNIQQFENKKLLALAAIGNPNNFFNLLENHNLNIKKKLFYPDHYKFSKNEITNILNYAEKQNYHIVMTEKDYFKFNTNKISELNYLKVSLQIDDLEELIKTINDLYAKKI